METEERQRAGFRGEEPISLSPDEGENLYAGMRKGNYRRTRNRQIIFIMAVALIVLYFVAIIAPRGILGTILNSSTSGYTLSWFIVDMSENLAGVTAVLTGVDTGTTSYAPLMIRYVIIVLAGAGLALCGAVYQGAFKNALVTPSTLGVMSGANLGMVIYVVLIYDSSLSTEFILGGAAASGAGADAAAGGDVLAYIMSSYGFALTSFVGCLLVVGVVLLVAHLTGNASSGLVMIISGQVVGAVIGAVVNAVRYWYLTEDPTGDVASLLTELQVSSFFRAYGVVDIIAVAVPLVVTFVVVLALGPRMMTLAFDEAEVRSIGIDANRTRLVAVALCTLLTAVIVSFCGTIGFVGFLVPHLARRLVGPNFKDLLPASLLLGGLFVLAAYMLVTVFLGNAFETVVGMFISIGGAGVFLVTALRGGGATRGRFQ